MRKIRVKIQDKLIRGKLSEYRQCNNKFIKTAM